MSPLTYPATNFTPAPVTDLTSKPERQRLTPSSLKAFFKIMEIWKIKDEDARELLGGVTNGPYYQLKKDTSTKVLTQDELLRVSYLIGIFRALGALHSKALGDQWIQLPNSNRIFGGASPLEYMKKGGTPAMQDVRRLLDARIQGM